MERNFLEKVFFYLMEERAKFFSDDKKREKYLELQEEIKKQKRSENLENKAVNEAKRIYLRDKAIMLKSDELKIIPYKRDDPYSFYFKKTQKAELLPNIVFDMANFIGSVVSSAGIQYVSEGYMYTE